MKFRKKTLLAKIEATYGTDSAPTGPLNAIQTSDLTISPLESEVLNLTLDKENLGADPGTLVGKHVRLTFRVPVAGSGTAGTAPAYGPLIIACGYAETVDAGTDVQYTPVDEAASITLHMKHDKVLHTITGARGTWRMVANQREYAWMEFEFIGLYNAPTSHTTSLGPVLTAFQKPVPFRAANVDFELFGQALCLRSLTVNGGQSNAFFECSEAESIQLEDRQGSFDASFLEPEIPTYNIWAQIDADNVGALEYTHGTVAGNIVEFVGHHAQITSVSREDDQGNMALSVSGPLARVGTTETTLTVR